MDEAEEECPRCGDAVTSDESGEFDCPSCRMVWQPAPDLILDFEH